jgi:hypothetical protein
MFMKFALQCSSFVPLLTPPAAELKVSEVSLPGRDISLLKAYRNINGDGDIRYIWEE